MFLFFLFLIYPHTLSIFFFFFFFLVGFFCVWMAVRKRVCVSLFWCDCGTFLCGAILKLLLFSSRGVHRSRFLLFVRYIIFLYFYSKKKVSFYSNEFPLTKNIYTSRKLRLDYDFLCYRYNHPRLISFSLYFSSFYSKYAFLSLAIFLLSAE